MNGDEVDQIKTYSHKMTGPEIFVPASMGEAEVYQMPVFASKDVRLKQTAGTKQKSTVPSASDMKQVSIFLPTCLGILSRNSRFLDCPR